MRLLIGSQERSRDREEWENADWTGLVAGLSGFSQIAQVWRSRFLRGGCASSGVGRG